jgi:2-hydroxychromene-2-carboxylate isomerase
MPKVEFHFDFGSPNAYLAHLVIPEIEQRTGAKFEYVPVLLGGVYKLTGNRSPAESLAGVKNKPDYAGRETARFIKRHMITSFRQNPFFPVNTLTIMRGAIAASGSACSSAMSTKSTGICGRNQKSSTIRQYCGPLCSNPASMPTASRNWSRMSTSKHG